jgi:hypothetical protein
MPRTPEEQKAWDLQAFGCTAESLRESKPAFYSPLMYAMAILSDAQEEAAGGNMERVRQYINRAKMFIDEERAKEPRA